ncbi:MAG: hypothetical protein JWQ71_2724 [Pedosphaera sp.]|nr:hypothetical protein [Pedosphaera sp.]
MNKTGQFIKDHDFPCWCGQSESRVICGQVFGRRPFLVLECAGCQTHRILPKALQTQASAEVMYNEYEPPDLSAPASEQFINNMWQRFGETQVQFTKGLKVLDVGCGNGILLDKICEKFGCIGRGIDVDERRIAKARAHSKYADFECGLFEGTKVREKYDVVVSSAVIEHVVDPVGFLKQLNMALPDDGTLFLLTPNARSLTYRLLRSWWRDLLSIGEHIYLFTPKSLELCAQRAGFKLVKTSFGIDKFSPKIRVNGFRDALITFWTVYREMVKRVSSRFAFATTHDILYAHFKKVGSGA